MNKKYPAYAVRVTVDDAPIGPFGDYASAKTFADEINGEVVTITATWEYSD